MRDKTILIEKCLVIPVKIVCLNIRSLISISLEQCDFSGNYFRHLSSITRKISNL